MQIRKLASFVTATLLVAGLAALPSAANAQDHGKHKGWDHSPHWGARDHGNDHRWNDRRRDDHRREQEWRRYPTTRRVTVYRPAPSYYQYRSTPRTIYQAAPRYGYESYQHRTNTMNEWRNIATVSGAVALLGLLSHDNRLVFPGTAGALYSLYRYEQDRNSRDNLARARAAYFSRPYFIRDGHRYDRVLVVQNGTRYYRFVRR